MIKSGRDKHVLMRRCRGGGGSYTASANTLQLSIGGFIKYGTYSRR